MLLPYALKTSKGGVEELFCRLHEAETRQREEGLWQEEICRGISLPEGGIAAIVITIMSSIIGIIINTISTISTIVTVTIPSHPAVAIVIVLLLVHWDRIPGVDYHL